MYLKKMHIENFRGIEKLDISFCETLNVIIGENNSGKTSVIDALRICLGLGYQRRGIWVQSEDFFIDKYGKKSETIRFDLTFMPNNEKEKGIFIELLAIVNNVSELQLHMEFSRSEKNGDERIKRKYWGGENEGQYLPDELLDLFYYTYLGVLRNSDRELSPGTGNRLAQLFIKLVNDTKDQKNYAEKINRVIGNDDDWKDLRAKAKRKINEHLNQTIITSNVQKIDLDFVSIDFKKIVEQLKIFLPFIGLISKKMLIEVLQGEGINDDSWQNYFQNPKDKDLIIKEEFSRLLNEQKFENKIEEAISVLLEDSFRKFEVSQNGLGYNNLIFIATVLGDILERKSIEPYTYISLFIEEPEAHLHPQLQNTLFNYFVQLQTKSIQVFITSHSPTITSKVKLDSLIVLQKKDKTISHLALKETGLNENNRKYLYKFLDVTKSQLFFANGVILVEGISESLLLPIFAEKLGYDLLKSGIEVVNIGGVAFEHFAKLFNNEDKTKNLVSRCSIITDNDKDQETDEIPSRAKNAEGYKGANLDVFLADKTFEKELYDKNEVLIKTIYKEMHSRTSIDSNSTFITKLNNFKDKSELSHRLSIRLGEKEVYNNFIVPEYIKNALKWVIDGIKEKSN